MLPHFSPSRGPGRLQSACTCLNLSHLTPSQTLTLILFSALGILYHLFKCHSWSYQKELAPNTYYVPGTVLGTLGHLILTVILKYCLHFPDEAAQVQGRECPCPEGLLSVSWQSSSTDLGLWAPKFMRFPLPSSRPVTPMDSLHQDPKAVVF